MKKPTAEKEDTIVAIATSLGEAAIGIVRMSGKDALHIADRVFSSKKDEYPSQARPFQALYGHIRHPQTGHRIDEVLLLVFRAPRSYTCEDMVEIQAHGGTISLREVLELLLDQGARLARPGEFTQRAFLNGRMDLSQAEAVLDVIHSKTEASLRSAMDQLEGSLSKTIKAFQEVLLDCLAHLEGGIDFPDEDLEIQTEGKLQERLLRLEEDLSKLLQTSKAGIVLREGLTAVIVGRPNVGKSSLLNALLRQNRAIVTPIAGTTRDAIEEMANIRGLPVRFVDTAGLQETDCVIEAQGILRSRTYLERADLVLCVLDGSQSVTEEDRKILKEVGQKPVIYVVSKMDLPKRFCPEQLFATQNGRVVVRVSSVTGQGIDALESAIQNNVLEGRTLFSEKSWVTNVRHEAALERARKAIQAARKGLLERRPSEIVAVDLREALEGMGEVVGEVFTEDLLDKIFSQFCIGK